MDILIILYIIWTYGWIPVISFKAIKEVSTSYYLYSKYVLSLHLHSKYVLSLQVVLDCLLKRDIRYVKANPKFHHWQTDEKRFGLTFERYDDAKAFDRGIRSAVADLVDGTNSFTILQCFLFLF